MTDRLCSLDDCNNKYMAKGYCRGHYQAWRRHGVPYNPKLTLESRFSAKLSEQNSDGCILWNAVSDNRGQAIISIDGRNVRAARVSWFLHHQEWPPDEMVVRQKCNNGLCVSATHLFLEKSAWYSTPEERFEIKVSEPNERGCLEWTGAISNNGYGIFSLGPGNETTAHRAAWFLFYDEMPPSSLDLCHRCDNRSCVNILHLFVGTRKDNVDDMMRKGRGNWERDPSSCRGRTLTSTQVSEIKRLVAAGAGTTELAGRYGVSISSIGKIKNGTSWKNVN